MVTAGDAGGARRNGASADAMLRKIKAAVARLRREHEAGLSDEFAALSRDIDALRDRLKDREAEVAYLRTRDQRSVPDAVLARLLAGESPLRVWREQRGLTLRALAARTKLGASTLSEIETGATEGSVRALRRIATALDVSIDDLIPPRGA
jgi:DNA-binding Xre family transcriptional regulator